MVDGTVGAVDNSGGGTKKVDTSEVVVGSNTVERQRMVIASNANPSAFATNFPAGFLRVSDEPTQIFYDAFDGVTIDTTIRWAVPIGSGGAVSPALSGLLTIASSTTANAFASISTQPSFTPTVPSWLGISFAIQTEYPVTINGYRFWGSGTQPSSPITTAPLTDAVGYELYTDGKLYAVVYASGVRTVIQDFSSATGNNLQPVDGLYHRYICYVRTDRTFWYIDQLDTVAAVSNFQAPSVQTLPLCFLAIAAATPPATSCVITTTGVAVWDTGKNNHTISDGVNGFRKATVSATGALGVDPSVGGPIQGTDGISKHSIVTDSFGIMQVNNEDIIALLKIIKGELTAIRHGMAHLTRHSLNPDQFDRE